MNTKRQTVVARLFQFTFAALMAFGSHSAFADQSCSALMNSKINSMRDSDYTCRVELTIHREAYPSVHYVGTWLQYNPGTDEARSFTTNLLFSERTGAQPFSVQGPPDVVDLRLDRNGLLTIHDYTWWFDWVVDLRCEGTDLATVHAPGSMGIVTLTFRECVPVIG
jgi:hypothetical protein